MQLPNEKKDRQNSYQMNRRTDNTVTKWTEVHTIQLPNEQKDRQYSYQMNRTKRQIMVVCFVELFHNINLTDEICISHFWDRPVPIFSDVRFSYLALVQDKKITCVLPANACPSKFYVNCPPILHAFPF